MADEAVTTKFVGAACRAMGLGLRAAEFEYKRGNGGPVVVDDGLDDAPVEQTNGTTHQAELARREADLLEQLAAIRKERAAG